MDRRGKCVQEGGERRVSLVHDFERGGSFASGERLFTGEQLKERYPHGEYVDAAVGRAAQESFRRNIVQGANQLAWLGQVGPGGFILDLGDAEVDDLRHAV